MEQKNYPGKTQQQPDRAADDPSRTKDMREANENVRKSQGEDSGYERTSGDHKPAIDRDR